MEEKILIGSKAILLNGHRLERPYVSDYDYIFPVVGYKKAHVFGEIRVEEAGYPPEAWNLIKAHSKLLKNGHFLSSISHLYTIKCSHAQFDVRWAKTAKDIIWFQKNFPDIKVDEELFTILYNFWLTVHKNHKDKVKLNQPKDKFFNKAVVRQYDHDSIHETVKFYSEPMYKKILREGSAVLPSRQKFEQLSQEDKIKLCCEEIFVISLERFLIPAEMRFSPIAACYEATKKLVTSATKGWFPKFIIENLNQISQNFNGKYIKRFEDNKHLLKELDENGTKY